MNLTDANSWRLQQWEALHCRAGLAEACEAWGARHCRVIGAWNVEDKSLSEWNGVTYLWACCKAGITASCKQCQVCAQPQVQSYKGLAHTALAKHSTPREQLFFLHLFYLHAPISILPARSVKYLPCWTANWSKQTRNSQSMVAANTRPLARKCTMQSATVNLFNQEALGHGIWHSAAHFQWNGDRSRQQ